MAKKKIKRHQSNKLEDWLCRTQGIGIMLARDVVKKMDSKIRSKCEEMIQSGESPNLIMAAMKPAPEPESQGKPKTKTPTE